MKRKAPVNLSQDRAAKRIKSDSGDEVELKKSMANMSLQNKASQFMKNPQVEYQKLKVLIEIAELNKLSDYDDSTHGNIVERIRDQFIPKNIKEQLAEEKKCHFAEPTYDCTFKLIFNDTDNKDLIEHFLSSMLGFKVSDVEIWPNDLVPESKELIHSSVDMLYKAKKEAEDVIICLEMQRKYENYFLARMQDYMSKIIQLQTKKGESASYHLAIKETYIIVFGKQDLFKDDQLKTEGIDLSDVKYFEKSVEPMLSIGGRNIPMPFNKTFWKYFELEKFHQWSGNASNEKEYWLYFLTYCGNLKKGKFTDGWVDDMLRANSGSQEEGLNYIKKGYTLMKGIYSDGNKELPYELEKIKEKYATMAKKTAVHKLLSFGLTLDQIADAEAMSVEEVKIIAEHAPSEEQF